MHSLLIS